MITRCGSLILCRSWKMEVVLQYSPLLLAEAEDALAGQEVSLSAPCQDVLRKLPAADAGLDRKALRHAAMHGSSLRPHLYGQLSDEQLMELVQFLDFWELPWLQMAQAERGARYSIALPPTHEGGVRLVGLVPPLVRPLDAYSHEAAAWALWKELEPPLQSVAQTLHDANPGGKNDSIDAKRVWYLLLQRGTPDPEVWVWCAVHVLCGARQPLFVPQDHAHRCRLSCILAHAGDLEALQWLPRASVWHALRAWLRGGPWDATTCAYAVHGGHLGVLQWLREQGCPWDGYTCASAALGGHLAVLQWARANGAPWNEGACWSAAVGGHLEVLQWLREHGAPWNEQTCAQAAGAGHPEVLQWARGHGCPWDEDTCSSAAQGGHMSVLQWAREHGCPWDEETCSSAAQGGHLSVLQWLRENGAPWDWRTCHSAAAGGHREVLQWLHTSGRPFPCDEMNHAAGWHPGCPWGRRLAR